MEREIFRLLLSKMSESGFVKDNKITIQLKWLGFFSFFSHRLKQERFNDIEGNTVTSSYDFSGNHAQGKTSVPCKPVNNILFLKVHKTSSSTVTNILNRYGDKRDLIFALPTEDSFHWPRRFEVSYATTFGGAPNILCNHARYNRAPMHFLFPKKQLATSQCWEIHPHN